MEMSFYFNTKKKPKRSIKIKAKFGGWTTSTIPSNDIFNPLAFDFVEKNKEVQIVAKKLKDSGFFTDEQIEKLAPITISIAKKEGYTIEEGADKMIDALQNINK